MPCTYNIVVNLCITMHKQEVINDHLQAINRYSSHYHDILLFVIITTRAQESAEQ